MPSGLTAVNDEFRAAIGQALQVEALGIQKRPLRGNPATAVSYLS